MLEQSEAEFPLTRWSLIEAITEGTPAQRTSALRTIAAGYWPAIYAYLRRKGNSQEKSVELTQSFFADIILERQLLEQAQSSKGALRSLLLTALKRHVIDRHRRSQNAARLEEFTLDAVAEEEQLFSQCKDLAPDTAFDRRWAVAVLSDALQRCEQHYRQTGKQSHWSAFELRVLRPSISMTSPPSHEQVAARLQLGSAIDSIAAVRVVRKRLQIVLRQIIAEHIADEAEQESEFGRVLQLLA